MSTRKPQRHVVRHILVLRTLVAFVVVLVAGAYVSASQAHAERRAASQRVRPLVPREPIEPTGGCDVPPLTDEVVGTTQSQVRLVARPLRIRGAYAVRIASDPQGGRAVVGSFRDQVQIGAHTENQRAMGVFVATMNSGGDVRWARSWSTDADLSAPAVAVAPNGTVVFAGVTGSSLVQLEGTEVPAGSAFVARWTSVGAFLGVSVVARRFSGARAVHAPHVAEFADASRSDLELAVGADAGVTIAGALESGAAVVHVRPDGTIRRTKVSDEYSHSVAVSEDGSAAFAFSLPDPDPNVHDPRDRIVRIRPDGSAIASVTLQGRTRSLAIGAGVTAAMVETYSGRERAKATAWSAEGSLLWEIADRKLARTFVHRGSIYVVHVNYSLDQPLMVRTVSRDGQQTDVIGFPIPLSPQPDVAYMAGSAALVHLAWSSIPNVHPHCSSVPQPDWMSVDLSALFR